MQNFTELLKHLENESYVWKHEAVVMNLNKIKA